MIESNKDYCWGIIIPHSGSARVGLYSVGSDYSGRTFGREGRLGREWKRSWYYMVGRESPGSLAFIRILVLVKSGQKSACSTMPSIFTPYWSLFTLYNNKTFCYSSTVKWSIYIYLSSKRYGSNLTLSIILSPSHTSTDLGVGGGSAGQPRRVFALLQVIDEGENLRLPRHQGRNRINSLAPSVGTIQSFLQKEKSGSGDRQNTSFVNCGFSQI
jgi:hypothetical protein